MIAQNYQDPKNTPTMIKQQTHSFNMYQNDSVITCNTEIPSVANMLKKIHPSTNIFNEFTSSYYDDKNDGFGFFSQTVNS